MLAVIVGIYLVLLLGIGWWANRRVRGMTDFLLAGRRLGLWLCAGALAATHFGGGALMGGAEYGFTHGISGAWYGVAAGIGLLLLAGVTARRFRALSIYTVPDYLRHRYGGKALRVLGALLSLIALVGILAAQVRAAGSAFTIIGLDQTTAAVLATVVFIVYTALGGLWAATVSDLFQIAIAGGGIVLAAIIVLATAGDAGGFTALLTDRGVGDGYFSPFGLGGAAISWILLPTVMYTLIGQDFYQRLFAARDADIAKRAALLGGIFLIVISLAPVLVGMGARALGGVSEATDSVPWVLQTLMHPVLGGIVLAAILAAIMSTADSLLTSATSHIVKDLWVETLGAGSMDDERKMLGIARLSTVVIGLAALLIGLAVPGIITLLIYSYTLYTAAVFVPVIGGVLWPGASRTAALASLVVGASVAIASIVTGADLWGVPTEIFAAAISALVFVGVGFARGDASGRAGTTPGP